jgi:miniconductance mechanosensitive channel
MDFSGWIQQNPWLALALIAVFSFVVFLVVRMLLGRGLSAIAGRTETKIDDVLVEKLRPFRIAWLAPLIIIYLLAELEPTYQVWIEKTALLLILWITVFTLNALMDALNVFYENSSSYKGVSIQGYLDIVKILVILSGIIVSVSLISGQSPLALLTGLGALTAILLLVFRDTILSFVASLQISTNDLVKEGDWIEVPSYDADGDVINMTLHTIKVQNWDKTISVIPTHKIMEVSYKNWRGMQESGGRRIKRAVHIDLASIRFCDDEMLERFRKVDILRDYLDQRLAEIEQERIQKGIEIDSPLDSRQLTNLGTYRAYIEAYLRAQPKIHQEGIQADILDHLLAAVPVFDLRVFQEPTGMDFAAGFSRID